MTLWPSPRASRGARRKPEDVIRAFLRTLERIAARADAARDATEPRIPRS